MAWDSAVRKALETWVRERKMMDGSGWLGVGRGRMPA